MYKSRYTKFNTEAEREMYKNKQSRCFFALSKKHPDWTYKRRLMASINMTEIWAKKVRSKGFL